MAVSKQRVFLALASLHSLMVLFTGVAFLYTAFLMPWREPIVYLTLTALFLWYYYYGGVLEMNIYADDSPVQVRLITNIASLHRLPYRPSPWILNANAQTLFAVIGRPNPNVFYEREMASDVFADGELCRLDWSFASNGLGTAGGGAAPTSPTSPSCAAAVVNPPQDGAPVVILFHGLTGGSDDRTMHYVTQAINRLGYHVVIPVRRGCGDDRELTKPKFYAYGGLEDTEFVVSYIAQKVAGRLLLGVGISAGSNILANYLAVSGADSKIKGAVSIANGYCWDRGTAALQDHHPVWDAVMSGIVHHNLFRRHDILTHHADHVRSVHETHPVHKLTRVGSIRAMDEFVSRRLHGYPSLAAFYKDQSCIHRLDKICVPTIFLNALDDPIANAEVIPYDALQRNPHTVLVTTACGGHLGWADGWWPFRNAPTWMDRMIVESLAALREEVERHEHHTTAGAALQQQQPPPYHTTPSGVVGPAAGGVGYGLGRTLSSSCELAALDENPSGPHFHANRPTSMMSIPPSPEKQQQLGRAVMRSSTLTRNRTSSSNLLLS